ncbi:MAG: shikimate dehydrogenase [Duncaniella sp.]|nr:shikimate dehydrogenase [Duncaniella sp.]
MSEHRVFGLIGYPLGHSFSRKYFTEKFAAENINAEYRNFEIPSIDLLKGILDSTPGLTGLNVTIPYKQQVMPMLDSLDPEAEAIGAVNVIKVTRGADGRIAGLKGYNSDVVGFRNSIAPLIKPGHKDALVLGTGGAAKAVWYGLKSLGLNPVYVSRSAREGVLTYADLDDEVMARCRVIVNATPLGMHPDVTACPPIPYDLITPDHVLYDVVYNPELTEFMRRGAERGATVKNGIEMLLGQAVEAWRIWNG